MSLQGFRVYSGLDWPWGFLLRAVLLCPIKSHQAEAHIEMKRTVSTVISCQPNGPDKPNRLRTTTHSRLVSLKKIMDIGRKISRIPKNGIKRIMLAVTSGRPIVPVPGTVILEKPDQVDERTDQQRPQGELEWHQVDLWDGVAVTCTAWRLDVTGISPPLGQLTQQGFYRYNHGQNVDCSCNMGDYDVHRGVISRNWLASRPSGCVNDPGQLEEKPGGGAPEQEYEPVACKDRPTWYTLAIELRDQIQRG